MKIITVQYDYRQDDGHGSFDVIRKSSRIMVSNKPDGSDMSRWLIAVIEHVRKQNPTLTKVISTDVEDVDSVLMECPVFGVKLPGLKLRDIAPNEQVQRTIDKMAADGAVLVADKKDTDLEWLRPHLTLLANALTSFARENREDAGEGDSADAKALRQYANDYDKLANDIGKAAGWRV